MGQQSPPWFPVFGNGAPGGSVPHNAEYFDVTTTPYTPYVYTGGAWHATGGGAAGGNAIQLQGVAVSAAPPSNGQVLQLAGGVWTPTTAAGGSAPAIVQSGIASTNTVVLGAAPTKGNLLVCVASHFSNAIVPFNPSAGKGWANFSQTDGSLTDGFLFFYKLCAAAETASQQPLNSNPTGITALWELSGATSIDVVAGQHDVQATPSITQAITTTAIREIVLALFATAGGSNLNLPTGVGGGLTQDQSTSGNSRAGVSGHMAAATVATYSPTATWAANPTNVVTAAIAVRGT